MGCERRPRQRLRARAPEPVGDKSDEERSEWEHADDEHRRDVRAGRNRSTRGGRTARASQRRRRTKSASGSSSTVARGTTLSRRSQSTTTLRVPLPTWKMLPLPSRVSWKGRRTGGSRGAPREELAAQRRKERIEAAEPAKSEPKTASAKRRVGRGRCCQTSASAGRKMRNVSLVRIASAKQAAEPAYAERRFPGESARENAASSRRWRCCRAAPSAGSRARAGTARRAPRPATANPVSAPSRRATP